jgi:hypothetical protein
VSAHRGFALHDPDNPRVDLMPPGAMFLWLLIGDVRKDLPWTQPPASSYPYLPPVGVDLANGDVSTVTQVPRLGAAPGLRGHRWRNVSSYWPEIVLLTDPGGRVDDQPLYLRLMAFAGASRVNIAALDGLVESLSYRYTNTWSSPKRDAGERGDRQRRL